MTTKTKTVKSTKDKLKSILVNELKSKKEDEKQIRRDENANIAEVTIYTKFSCPFCTQIIDKLKDEGIKYLEKPQLEFEKETNDIFGLTGMPIFPTLVVNEEYLVPRRDFQNPQQLIDRIKIVGKLDYTNPPFETRVIEMMKSNGVGMNTTLQQMSQQMGQIQQKLTPMVDFINNIQSQIEEEEKSE